MPRYRNVATIAPDFEPMEYYTSEDSEPDLADWLAHRTEAMAAADFAGYPRDETA